MAAAITPRTRALLLNSPHNPTGSIIDEETLTGIAALCQKHDFSRRVRIARFAGNL